MPFDNRLRVKAGGGGLAETSVSICQRKEASGEAGSRKPGFVLRVWSMPPSPPQTGENLWCFETILFSKGRAPTPSPSSYLLHHKDAHLHGKPERLGRQQLTPLQRKSSLGRRGKLEFAPVPHVGSDLGPGPRAWPPRPGFHSITNAMKDAFTPHPQMGTASF